MYRENWKQYELQREHEADFAFVVNHSGGKDSTRMLGFVHRRFPESRTHAVMADTGFSCWVCIFSTDADLRAIHQHNRKAFDMVSNLEIKTDFTMRGAPVWCRSWRRRSRRSPRQHGSRA